MTDFPYMTFTGEGAPSVPLDYHIAPRDALLVDLAIKLGRPLLIEGEAGCGKTTLANAVASELGLGKPIIEPIRSTSRANDLFYRVDTLRRLMDSNIPARQEHAADVQNYITPEPVGKAIVEGRQAVILIDEIDKADMDFQNDLLFALERFEFNIDEIPASETRDINGVSHRMSRKGGAKPIVMFTSNQEKLLPKPFLRRCIYLQLNFPASTDQLVKIVRSNLDRRVREKEAGWQAIESISDTIVDNAVTSFTEIRAKAKSDGAIKTPATSELLDWVHALHVHPEFANDLSGLTPPLWKMLFRTAQDQDRHARHATGSRDT